MEIKNICIQVKSDSTFKSCKANSDSTFYFDIFNFLCNHKTLKILFKICAGTISMLYIHAFNEVPP